MSDLEFLIDTAKFMVFATVSSAIAIPLIHTYVPKFVIYMDNRKEKKRIKKCIENNKPPFKDNQLYLDLKELYE